MMGCASQNPCTHAQAGIERHAMTTEGTMTQDELEAKVKELRRSLDRCAEVDSPEATGIEQDLDHYRQRLANVRAGYPDNAVLRRTR